MIDDSNGKPPPAQKTRGLGRLARGASDMFSRLPGLGHRGDGAVKLSARASAELARRVAVPILAESVEVFERREIERGFARLADEALWHSILDRIRGVDLSRQTFASGRRYFDSARAGALNPVTRNLRPKPKLEAAIAALPNLSSLHAADTRDYMPAVLLARAKIEIAWAMRGAMQPSGVSEKSKRSAAVYFGRAEAAIESFDPIELNSPMLAESRYLITPGIENGGDYLRDWYEDWADLDPSNPNMLATHSRFLMPDWYGDLDEIDYEARRAITRADDGLGFGAYPMFWRRPLEIDASALAKIDPDLFILGVHSALMFYDSQELANEYAALLYRLSRAASSESSDAAARTAPIRARLGEGFAEVVRRHLLELHAPVWGLSEQSLRLAMTEAFPKDYADGAILRPGKHGIEAATPDDGPDDAPDDATAST